MIRFTKEQIYIVTGASSGLGEATALLLNELGASVVAIARNIERLENMKTKCKNPENMFIEVKDLTEDIEGLPKYIKELKEKYGKFSGMAYCAGITEITPLKIIDLEMFERIFKIDYQVPLFMIKGLADKRNILKEGASIAVVSSRAGNYPAKGMTLYCGAKAAIISSVGVIAKECSNMGLRINTVSPSDIETPMTQTEDIKTFVEDRLDYYPFGIGKPNDVASMLVYLLSKESRFISGQNFIIDSGGAIR